LHVAGLSEGKAFSTIDMGKVKVEYDAIAAIAHWVVICCHALVLILPSDRIKHITQRKAQQTPQNKPLSVF